MAKRQYVVSSDGQWTSNSGYSFLALFNQSGSGRKLTLRQLSVFVLSQKGAATPVCNARLFQSATPFVGENMLASAVRLDSAATLPATVVVRRSAQLPALGGASTLPVSLIRHSAAAGSQETIYCTRTVGHDRLSAAYRSGSKRGTTAVEPITIPQNTGVGLVVTEVTENQPVRVNLVVSVDGKTVVWDFVSVARPGLALFSLENTGTAVVKLLRYSFAELGTTDTPFIRLVPIGQIYSPDIADGSKQGFSVQKLNSSYPDLTALKVLGDIGFIPSGSPEVVINEGSAGTPKGVNYLHTRDFNGPAYRVFLPEMRAGGGPGVGNDMLGHHNSHRANDLLTRMRGSAREAITLNPGEGLALVASSETFIGVQGAFSGWPGLSFQAIVDSEPLINPTLTLTGLKNPTEVRIFSAGTTTELVGQETITSGTFTWAYDPDAVTAVDISILALNYQNLRILGVATTGNVEIPVQQQLDRNYANT